MGKRRGRLVILHAVVITLLFSLILDYRLVQAEEGMESMEWNKASQGRVTFIAEAGGIAVPANPKFHMELICDGKTEASVMLSVYGNESATRPNKAGGKLCEVKASSQGGADLGDEVHFTISDSSGVLARRVVYPDGNEAASTTFYAPQGDFTVQVTQDFASGDLGTPIRTMIWNIWGGGRSAGGTEDVDQLIDMIRDVNPDILFMVETYESGEIILDGINAGLPENHRYTGVKVTNEPRHQPQNDNLWIFSRFPIVEQYPHIEHPRLSSFHFGGVKIQLPDGQEVNLFNTWLHHLEGAYSQTNKTVGEIIHGLPRTYTSAELLATDLFRRVEMARIILDEHLPVYLEGDDSPVIMAGDFNTLSHEDWSARFADAPGHAGLVLPWPVTELMQQAGFTDTYRWANPDAGRFPGSTWSPHYGYGMAPGRIDYIWKSGGQIRILDSHTRDERLPGHEIPGFPFYSDHAAVVTDMFIRHPDSLPPAEPKPRTVPQSQMTATATSQHTGYEASKAIDGDLTTMWHTRWNPPELVPQAITLDLGGNYDVAGLSYQTRTDFKPDGVITEYRIYTSADGNEFTLAGSGTWNGDYSRKAVTFPAVANTRYVRLEAIDGSGGYAAAADIQVYYETEEQGS